MGGWLAGWHGIARRSSVGDLLHSTAILSIDKTDFNDNRDTETDTASCVLALLGISRNYGGDVGGLCFSCIVFRLIECSCII